MTRIPTINQIQQLSPEELAELNKKTRRAVALHILGFAAVKITIFLLIRDLAKTLREMDEND